MKVAGLLAVLAVMAPGWVTASLLAPAPPETTTRSDTVHVAPPTGETETDRASILTALGEVEPGGMVLFGPGTYLVGEAITVAVPEVTLLGHPDGTTLRGCDPSAFENRDSAVAECNGFDLTGGDQTVRDLTFEYTWLALNLGGEACKAGDCPPETLPVDARTGGYVVEQNTFRESPNGIRVVGQWQEPAVIRDNRFINTYHAVMVRGMTAHVLDNHISVPKAERVPNMRHPGGALGITGWGARGMPACDRNVISGNRIVGHPDAIAIVQFPGGVCRDNVIRDNTIEMSQVRFESASTAIHIRSTADSTIAGVAIALLNGVFGDGVIEGTLIEGNRIIGAQGLAIEVLGASDNRIVDNTIIGVTARDPFPGNTLFPRTPEWDGANGSGIWVSSGSDENEIVGNTFEDVGSYAVVLEGNSNRVELTDPADAVRDLGTGNRVSGPDPSTAPLAYESKFVETRGVRLHYLDFGGSGLPVIFVHDWYEDAHTWTSFAPLFADAYRVLAMTRRGYGESDDVGWGYDVTTQSEDILGFMDALGIERAVLLGRHPTTQDMTWIAEHHPERLAGLVYLYHAIAPSPGGGRMLRDRTFAKMMMRYGGCWMGEEAYHRSAPRLLYRPHYIDDPELRIEVPAISFTHPQDFAAGAGDVEFLDLTLQLATGADPGGEYCDPAAIRTSVDYLTALANDPERLAEVRPLVPTREERKRYAEAFERAFGPNLRIVRLEQPANYRTDPEPYYARIRTFLEELARREAARDVDPAHGPRVVHVAPPTGEKETDRASILAALERVRPGDTVQFATGTYRVGESMRIATARITLLGNAGGTVLRGCDPDEQEEVERRAVQALVSGDQETYGTMRRRCGLLELTGGNVTVRGLTFEHARTGLVLGCCEGEEVSGDGGYLVEGNSFRNSANGIRASLVSAEPTIIRDNRFVNVFHALSAGVSRVHMLDNDISVPEPDRVPGTGHPGFAIGIRPPVGGPGTGPPVCEHNVIVGNRIEGHTDGILLRAFDPGTSCRHNTVRDNVIEVKRVPVPVPWLYAGLLPLTDEADTTFAGIPLGLLNFAARAGAADGDAGRGGVQNNLIERNRVLGAHGVGIQVLDASRNRIASNTLTGIRRRDPLPGNITTGSQEWGEANGSAIWVSPGSDDNEIVGNNFEDIAAFAVVLEGDSNRVELTDPADAVRDLGTGNRVSGPDPSTAPPAYESRFIDANGVRLDYLASAARACPSSSSTRSRAEDRRRLRAHLPGPRELSPLGTAVGMILRPVFSCQHCNGGVETRAVRPYCEPP